MQMQINETINGFRLERRREVPELNGTLWEFTHERSGAKLAWLDNGEENKLFSVAFKTLPWDDTGVFHIMEHSVLGGSERYPVKEPFLDLLKSSMNTFLNAMTFSDKTVYPVSSRNEQDFMNLTEVYLDAVFRPSVYTDPNIFRQEGWHYELRAAADAPVYKGVVFNEMKGAFSNVDSLTEMEITRILFPDSPYGFESGGDPAAIPDLTYERFLDAHREFYSPENALIWLDGDVPFERVTRLMDGDYLSKYEKTGKTHPIPVQTPVPAAEAVRTYAVGADEETADRTFFAIGKILCGWEDRKKLLAAQTLASFLTGSNAAPLKRALLSAGVCQDVNLFVDDGVFQPYLLLQIRGSEAEKKDEIRRVIRETVSALVKNGIDREELTAELNQLEFSLRETDEPKGLSRNINALSGWLHGGDPLACITFNDLTRSLRDALDGAYYEDLLAEMLLDDAHLCTVTLLPSRTRAEEDARREADRLTAAAAAWTAADRERLVAENEALDLWHDTPDSKEATATLPVLDLKDVSDVPLWTETEETAAGNAPVWFHKVRANGVLHVSAYFNVNDVPAAALPAVSFLTDLLGELPTARYDAQALQREIKKNIGALRFSVSPYAQKGDPAKCVVKFVASFSVLPENLEAAEALTAEILLRTDFSDRDAVKELLLQTEDDVNQNVQTRGNTFALRRAGSAFSAATAVAEQTDGFGFFAFLKKFIADFDGRFAAFADYAASFCRDTFTADRMLLSLTADDKADLTAFATAFPATGAPAPAFSVVTPDGAAKKELYPIPAGVSYAAAVWNAALAGEEFSGRLNVLGNLLSFGYLWNEIRVKGGAYGCGFRSGFSGNLVFYSYRDPAPADSLSVYAATADFIRAFVASDEDTDKYVISSIAGDEPLSRPAALGAEADGNRFAGIGFADKQRIRREMLALKKEDLLSLCPLFEKAAAEAGVCVVCGADAIDPEKEGFAKITLG